MPTQRPVTLVVIDQPRWTSLADTGYEPLPHILREALPTFALTAASARRDHREGSGNTRVVEEHAPARLASSTILVVDDERAVRRPLAANLEDAGYRVLEAESGDIA